MKAVSVVKIRKELHHRSHDELMELCLRLAKFKKENKELLTYLLFEADNEEQYIQTVIEDLNPVKHGTKMELFETLHNWRQLSVVKRGWATAEEKKEIEEIYTIYHDKLGGNGNGERYYKEILALPESEEEKEAKKNV